MSRPFSYNDESFTVIGNILFLHAIITKEYKQGDYVIEIPEAIYDRMYNKSNKVLITSNRDNNGTVNSIDFGITDFSGKHYMYTCQKNR